MGIKHKFFRLRAKILKRNVIHDEYYFGEGVESFHNARSLKDSRFDDATRFAKETVGNDYRVPQRLQLLGWAAEAALKNIPDGAVVELGTGRGFCMLFTLHWLAAVDLHPKFFLFDTFQSELPQGAESRGAIHSGSNFFAEGFEKVNSRFSEFESVQLIQGELPGTLVELKTEKIAFLHIDLNDGEIEATCLERIFPLLQPGGIIVFDDYANRGRNSQREEINQVCRGLGISVLSTPQGQGLAIKPTIAQ